MTQIKDIVNYLQTIAPSAYQEKYDNAQLITGAPSAEVTGILTTLDCTEDVVDEAIKKGLNVIVAHHPIVFSGLKSLTGKNYVERTVINAIKNDIAILAVHTNIDNVFNGVNHKICEKLALENLKILAPKSGLLKKLTVFIPEDHISAVQKALNKAGAGQIGKYDNCSFQSKGKGTFQPTDEADPYIGEQGKLEIVDEIRLEVIYSAYIERKVLQAMFGAHPYEEVAYYIQDLGNEHQNVGSGMYGELSQELSLSDFISYLKNKMNLKVVKHTRDIDKKIRKVAVCGGAGSFLLGKAMAAQADLFITSDYKYHEYFDADGKIVIADIGHYESEVYTKELFCEILTKKFTNIAIVSSLVNTNPVIYS